MKQLQFYCCVQLPLKYLRQVSQRLIECWQALEKHGVGNWREISEQYLPKWDDQAIRIKASRLIGSQSLARYIGWKGNR